MWSWEEAGQKFPVGRLVTGAVASHHSFGVFVDLNDAVATGLVQITEFLDADRMTAEQYPPVGTVVTGVVLGHTELQRRQVWLSMRPSRLRARGPAMTELEWLICASPVPMLEFLRGRASDRKLRLFAVAALRYYLEPPCPTAYRPLLAAAEGIADGTGELNPRSCYWIDSRPGEETAIRAIVEPTLGGYESDQRKCGWLRDIFGNPFRPVAFSSSWRTDTALSLARQMYDSRTFSAMPILADALQDAGCDNDDILNHCRDTTQAHTRGCWVVDLVLGRE